MKTKSLFLFALSALTLASCGGSAQPSSSAPAESSPETSSAAGTSSRQATSSQQATSSERQQTSVAPTSSAQPSSSQQASSSPAASYSGELPQYDPSGVKDCIILHYRRPADAKYDDWALWLWDAGNGGEGSEYLPQAIDEYGSVFYVPLSTWSASGWAQLTLGVIVKSKGSWAKKDPDGDRKIVLSDLQLDDNGNYSVWLWTATTAIYKAQPEYPFFISRAYVKSAKVINVQSGNGTMKEIDVYKNGQFLKHFGPYTSGKRVSLDLTLDDEITLKDTYSVTATYDTGFQISSPVDVSSLYDTTDFQTKYTYTGNDLGAVYTATKTTFKVWSPTSESIKLRVYDSGTPVSLDADKGDDTHRDYVMTQGDKGVWSVAVEGDLAGKYYTYVVTNGRFADKEVVDPYAKSAGINGVRGMVVDFSKTNPEGWDDFRVANPYEPQSLTVYETHVSDVTNHATWTGTESRRGKFLGLTEEGTRYEGVTTGFDHIKELGVNAVQLQPMFDHANDERPDRNTFNWGYNPLNYNVIEGSYSSDPYDGYVRIREFKQVVKAYHDAGINVIMDVVYNHVNSVDGLQFDVLAPNYYFRYNSDGSLSNGSGCGNETASNRPMFRKFMVDSTAFWAKEYKLGGFRFDLMALHDLTAMNSLTNNLRNINPKIAVYGEPWTGGTSTLAENQRASQANAMQFQGYAQFNDYMRDCLVRSGMKGRDELGMGFNKWRANGQADTNGVGFGLKGFTGLTVTDSSKTVNYITCHDNFTFNDRILAYERAHEKLHEKDPTHQIPEPTTAAERAKMNLLSQSFALTSQGISFFLAGEEMLRSKFELTDITLPVDERLDYAHNTYNTTVKFDGAVVNALDYSRKLDFPELFQGYKQLVALKKGTPGLQQTIVDYGGTDTSNLIDVKVTKQNQIVQKFASESWNYAIVYNTGFDACPAVDLSGYELVFDSTGSLAELGAETPMANYQVVVARKAAA